MNESQMHTTKWKVYILYYLFVWHSRKDKSTESIDQCLLGVKEGCEKVSQVKLKEYF